MIENTLKTRLRKPPLRWWIVSVLLTLVFSTIVGLIASAYYDFERPQTSFTISYSIAFSVLLFEFVGSLVSSQRRGQRETIIVLAGLAGMAAGLIVAGLLAMDSPWYLLFSPTSLIISLTALVVAIVYVIYALRLRDSDLQIASLTQEQLRQEKELAEARLKNLQNQVQPHFLFNALANVQSNIRQDPELSVELIGKLSDFLRRALEYTKTTEAEFRDECELIELYLDIQNSRMGDRLTYEVNVPSSLDNMPISPFLLQPLVENAVIHGIEPKHEGGHISVRATHLGDDVQITIEDSGIGFGADHGVEGTGLSNIKRRLEAQYDRSADLSITSDPGGGTKVTLTLPTRQSQ